MQVINAQMRRGLADGWQKTGQWLAENKALAKITDKNLGLAVFPVSWYFEQVRALLSDTTTYQVVGKLEDDLTCVRENCLRL
ncbi:hypothetical protein KEM54_005005, partial [Ascosphaera aggregata]